jgi:hypothetical protein
MRKTFEKEDVFSQVVLNDQAFLKKGAASGTNAMLEGRPYLAELEKERIRRSTPVLMKVGQSERWQNGRTRELTTALVSLGLSNPAELPTGGDALGVVPVAALIVPAVQKDEIEKAVRDECSRLGGDAVTANRDSTKPIRGLPANTEWLQGVEASAFQTYGDYVTMMRSAMTNVASRYR